MVSLLGAIAPLSDSQKETVVHTPKQATWHACTLLVEKRRATPPVKECKIVESEYLDALKAARLCHSQTVASSLHFIRNLCDHESVEYKEGMQRKKDNRGGGKNSSGYDRKGGLSRLQASQRALYQGGGKNSCGYDRKGGPKQSQLSGRIRGAATPWGKGKHGTKNLGKNVGKNVGKYVGKNVGKNVGKGTSKEQEKRNQQTVGVRLSCYCQRSCCKFSTPKAHESDGFKNYFASSKGAACAEIVRGLLTKKDPKIIKPRIVKYLPEYEPKNKPKNKKRKRDDE
jgi:hypothetical protein